jgi:hypothetical protein
VAVALTEALLFVPPAPTTKQLMRAEEETDAVTRRAEEAEAALSVARSGPDVAEGVRLELQAAMARIDTLSKAVGDQTAVAQQASERAFVLEEDLRVRGRVVAMF